MADPKQTAPGVPLAPLEDTSFTGTVSKEFTGPSMRGQGIQAPPSSISGGRLEPTPEEIQREVLYGTGAGTIEGASVMGGGVTGLRIGTAIAPFTGPAAPFMPALGFAGGVTAGYLLSKDADSLFPAVARQDLIPYREGAKTFGQSIGAAPFAFGIPAIQGGRVAQFVTNLGEGARKYPKSYLFGETISGLSSGVAGGTAVEYAPDSPGTRLVSEIVAGVFSPGRLIVNGTTALGEVGKRLVSGASEDARQTRAANQLRTILTETGEDIPTLIKRLEALVPADVTATAAQKTGSATLGVLETTLARNNPKYAAAIRKQGQDSIRAYELIIQNLNSIGSPEALRQAAIMRQKMFTDLLDTRLQAAEVDAAAQISKISRDTPQARVEVGRIVQSLTEQALRDARSYEKALWTEAFRNTMRQTKGGKVPTYAARTVEPGALGYVGLDVGASMTPERFNALPVAVRSILGRIGITGDAINVFKEGRRTQEFLDTGIVPDKFLPQVMKGKRQTGAFDEIDVEDLINIRSDLLDFARNASSAGEVANAGFYSKLADAALTDLNGMRMPAYDKAREFSRTLNDYFTRSFAGQVAKTPTRGAQPFSPEILVQRAFSGGNDLATMRMADIEDAVGMMRREYDAAVQKFGAKSQQALDLEPFAKASDQAVDSIQDAQTRVLRMAAAKTIDPATGRLNTSRLAKFVADNKQMLDRLQITPDLENATRAENAFRALQTQTSQVVKTVNQQAAFAKIMKLGPYERAVENPTLVIGDILNSKNPVKNFAGLARLAKSGGPDAVAGFKASLFDYAFIKAGGERGFSPAAFQKAFFEPLSPGQPSLYSVMRSTDVMSLTEGKNLRRLIAPMERIETAMRNNQLMDDVVQGGDAITELTLRVIGSRLGSAVSSGGPGSLIAASAGSKYMRSIFDKTPTLMVRGIIEQATQDPQLMAELLKRGQNATEKFQIARNLHSYMTAAGLNYASFDEEAPQAPRPKSYFDVPVPNFSAPVTPRSSAPPPFQSNASQMLRKLPPAPKTRGVPGLSMSQESEAMPPTAAAGPQGAPSTDSRAAFQQLFPMDAVAPLLNQPPAA
jgi:hypothetical protein